MSLFFNTLSRFVITFLPTSKHVLILWLQLPSTVILESKKIKSVTATASTFSLPIRHEVMGLDAMELIDKKSSLVPDHEKVCLYNCLPLDIVVAILN